MESMIQKIKNFLKRFLPPPVHAFNREVERILSAIQSLAHKQDALAERAELLADQNKALARQNEALARQADALAQQTAALTRQMESQHEALAQARDALTQQAEAQLADIRQISEQQQLHLDSELEALRTQVQSLRQEASAQKEALSVGFKSTLSEQLRPISRDSASANSKLQRLENGVFRTTAQPRLAYFVLNILDHCNLRCKGCDHFAAIAEERFVALEDIQRDLAKMSQLTQGRVTRIGVMGGEPLLHPQLKEILTETRKYFPHTLIQLVSNGLLLLRQTDEFWQVCRDNNISIVVTKYPLNLDFDRMIETAKAWDVSFEFYGNTGEVTKTSYKMPMDVNGRQNPIKSFWECYHANALPLLMEGKFYPCTVAPNAKHFNKNFGANMALESGDFLDIHSIDQIEELYRFLCSPKPFCRYCRTGERGYGLPWERSKQIAEEWT